MTPNNEEKISLEFVKFLDDRFDKFEKKWDCRFDRLEEKVDNVDARLTTVEVIVKKNGNNKKLPSKFNLNLDLTKVFYILIASILLFAGYNIFF